jgi:hypothetical protein
MNILNLICCTALIGQAQTSTDLNDGYVRLETASYQVDLPINWKVTPETSFGQRKAKPSSGGGELGMMTAPPSQQSWDRLYETALFYILRGREGKATPYKIVKTKGGYEAASFDVLDKNDQVNQKYVMIKHSEKGLLALSVEFPNQATKKEWSKHFKRMVDSARFIE